MFRRSLVGFVLGALMIFTGCAAAHKPAPASVEAATPNRAAWVPQEEYEYQLGPAEKRATSESGQMALRPKLVTHRKSSAQ
jgi:hypothetical protein